MWLIPMRGVLKPGHPPYCLLTEFGSCSGMGTEFSVSLAEPRVTLLAGAYQMLTVGVRVSAASAWRRDMYQHRLTGFCSLLPGFQGLLSSVLQIQTRHCSRHGTRHCFFVSYRGSQDSDHGLNLRLGNWHRFHVQGCLPRLRSWAEPIS
jgi:hypothetical protein